MNTNQTPALRRARPRRWGASSVHNRHRNLKIDSLHRARIVRRIKIRIREACLPDAPIIAEFNRRMAWETERLQLDLEVLRKGVTAVLSDVTKGTYYVAETNGAVVGQLMITYEWSDWRNGNLWWIQSVFVKEEFRGQGVFRALFKHLENLARSSDGVAGLRLYMHADNKAARQTYERLGMKHSEYEVFEVDFVLNRNRETLA
jgi:GNAT superfamily N-acetyltransferase